MPFEEKFKSSQVYSCNLCSYYSKLLPAKEQLYTIAVPTRLLMSESTRAIALLLEVSHELVNGLELDVTGVGAL